MWGETFPSGASVLAVCCLRGEDFSFHSGTPDFKIMLPIPFADRFFWVSVAPVEENIFHVGFGRNGDP